MTSRLASFLVLLCVVVAGCSTSAGSASVESGPIEAGSSSTDAATSERDQAVERLINEAFLPERAAECVVDTTFFEAGVYDVTSEEAQALVNQAAVIDQCSELAAADGGQVPLPVDLLPAVNPGGLATGSITLNGATIDYVTITPRGFQINDEAPVFLALPPGGQDLEITTNVALSVYQQQALARGWVVVSPASPSGRWFDEANASAARAFTSWAGDWVSIESGKPHLGGMSNGGLSAFSFAARNPTGFRSLLAYPGFPQAADSAVLNELGDIPVRLWVGSLDTQWVAAMESTATELRRVGADVELSVLLGEPHVIQSIADGVLIFDQLDAARR